MFPLHAFTPSYKNPLTAIFRLWYACSRERMIVMTNEEKILEMLSKMHSDISDIKSDVSGIKGDIQDLRSEIAKNFRSTRSEIVDAVEMVGQKVERLEGNIKAVEDVTAQNAYDVQLMKRRV